VKTFEIEKPRRIGRMAQLNKSGRKLRRRFRPKDSDLWDKTASEQDAVWRRFRRGE
jgi:hypothetical protein